MAAVKSMEQITSKWTRVTPQRQEDFAIGVANPRTDWQTATLAAESAWKTGIQQAVSQGSWSKGVQSAGTAKWKARASGVGPGRWAEGIAGAGDAYSRGFRPYREALAALALPPRGPKGDPKNIQRVAIIADTLHKVKRAQGA